MSDITKITKKCVYKNKSSAVDIFNKNAICSIHQLPCNRVIESGECKALIEYAKRSLS